MRNDAIEMNDGRVLRLESLKQWRTYAGLLEGTPPSEKNRRYLDNLLKGGRGSASYLVTPKERSANRPGVRVALGWLPHITCDAEFVSDKPARDPDEAFSTLRIVWLQEDFALPIAPEALAHIQAMDWNAHAEDCSP